MKIGRPSDMRPLLWGLLIDGKEIDPVEFSKSHHIPRRTVNEILNQVRDHLITRKFPHPSNKSEQNRYLYKAGNVKAIQARLDDHREKVYDMETVNMAMNFVGQPVDIPYINKLTINNMIGAQAKDPDEVDYIPDWRE